MIQHQLPSKDKSFMMAITDQISAWKPSHETLINCVIPCLTCTEDYMVKIAEFKSWQLEKVYEMYKKNTNSYEIVCREYLNQMNDEELSCMFNDIVCTEREISNSQGHNAYPYQLLQYGIITSDNWNLLCPKDLTTFITHMKKENISRNDDNL